jgi:NDP-sugar pyrophosphorylase family protein
MKAMILAAGLGTRLRPLTDDRPKALVEVAGRTLLEITLCRLRTYGVREVVVNTHHYADMILKYLEANQNFGLRIEVSREQTLLDTGGGLKNAAYFFLQDRQSSQEPFILHNVDVISTIDLGRMIRFHEENDALATLAVQDRETSRYLLFDEHGQLSGRLARRVEKAEVAKVELGESEFVRPAREVQALAFTGIHVISPHLFPKMKEEGAFSIIDSYLHLAAQREKVVAFRADEYEWRDLGRPENIAQAALDLARGRYAGN